MAGFKKKKCDYDGVVTIATALQLYRELTDRFAVLWNNLDNNKVDYYQRYGFFFLIFCSPSKSGKTEIGRDVGSWATICNVYYYTTLNGNEITGGIYIPLIHSPWMMDNTSEHMLLSSSRSLLENNFCT